MPRGGHRENAGRKKGAPNKASAARQAEVAASGVTPLEVMLRNMRAANGRADALETRLDEPDLKPEAMVELLGEIARYRSIAQDCDKDAAKLGASEACKRAARRRPGYSAQDRRRSRARYRAAAGHGSRSRREPYTAGPAIDSAE